MCDFKPGDELVCVNAGPLVVGDGFDHLRQGPSGVVKGAVYTVRAVQPEARAVLLVEATGAFEARYGVGFHWSRFRKVERRKTDLSIEAFLTIKPGFEEPKRAPAKKRERA